ncbi:hypothetical protein HaLaN_00233 [Haematococcus lacustris]|uniref:Uncharacterized protein n=1 Tax=Haematococcus lacustris TaxID=44745 RepID=A0A699YF66_HAELA|nr:hypothetical protein HaLaN_00233 [Haematococcus lacustris]
MDQSCSRGCTQLCATMLSCCTTPPMGAWNWGQGSFSGVRGVVLGGHAPAPAARSRDRHRSFETLSPLLRSLSSTDFLAKATMLSSLLRMAIEIGVENGCKGYAGCLTKPPYRSD